MNNAILRRPLLAAGGFAILLGGVLLTHAYARDTEPKGKFAPWVVMKTANKSLNGTPISAAYALEGGKWIYDVLITKSGKLYEVEVDAMTGKAGKPEVVTAEEEAKEMTADISKAMSKPVSGKETEEKDGKPKNQ